MNNKEQITFLALRESQHRGRAERAMRVDTAAFHEEMATTFQRLAEEAQASMEPSIDSSASASFYLNW